MLFNLYEIYKITQAQPTNQKANSYHINKIYQAKINHIFNPQQQKKQYLSFIDDIKQYVDLIFKNNGDIEKAVANDMFKEPPLTYNKLTQIINTPIEFEINIKNIKKPKKQIIKDLYLWGEVHDECQETLDQYPDNKELQKIVNETLNDILIIKVPIDKLNQFQNLKYETKIVPPCYPM